MTSCWVHLFGLRDGRHPEWEEDSRKMYDKKPSEIYHRLEKSTWIFSFDVTLLFCLWAFWLREDVNIDLPSASPTKVSSLYCFYMCLHWTWKHLQKRSKMFKMLLYPCDCTLQRQLLNIPQSSVTQDYLSNWKIRFRVLMAVEINVCSLVKYQKPEWRLIGTFWLYGPA